MLVVAKQDKKECHTYLYVFCSGTKCLLLFFRWSTRRRSSGMTLGSSDSLQVIALPPPRYSDHNPKIIPPDFKLARKELRKY